MRKGQPAMSGWREFKKKEEEERKKAEEQGRFWRRVGYFTGIPAMFFAFGAAGFLVGTLLERRFHANGILMAVSVLFFMIGAFREIFTMIKRL